MNVRSGARVSEDKINPTDYMLSAASGLLLTAAFPKIGLTGCVWFSLVPLLFALRRYAVDHAFWLGFTTGVFHFISLLYWLVDTMQIYGNLPLPLSLFILALFALYLSLYVALFSALLVRFGSGPLIRFALIPALWVSLEYLRSMLLSGFPWELIGYSLYGTLPFIQICDLTGVYGLSFLVAGCNGAVLAGLLFLARIEWQGTRVKRGTAAVVLGAAAVMLLAVWFYGQQRIAAMDRSIGSAETVRVSVVQGNIDQALKWDPAFQQAATETYIRLSLEAQKTKPDLIVWPETATPFYFLHDARLTARVISGIRAAGSDFLIGSPSFRAHKQGIGYYNSAYLVSAEGKIDGRYDKVHLVPFGEYVPFKRWLPFLGKIVANVGDFKAGTRGNALAWRRFRIGTLICFEIIFPQLSRAMAENQAAFLVNMTNDAWFGTSGGPYQHFSMAIFRAVENRRSLIRSANTGISAFIDPVGRVMARTPLGEEAVITGDVPILKDQTLFVRYGDVFAFGCMGLTLLVFGRRLRIRR